MNPYHIALLSSEIKSLRGTPLTASALGLTTLGWAYPLKSANYPQVSTTKDYFFLYSPHHDTGDGGIYWGECDDLFFNGIITRGQILTGHQAEFPWAMNIPTSVSGLASDTFFLYYHTSSNDPDNNNAQETHLITSTGGDLHTATWTERNNDAGENVLGLNTGEDHTGYLRAFKRPTGDYIGNHLLEGGVGGDMGISTSDDGVNWTRLGVMDLTAGMPEGSIYARDSIYPFTYNDSDYCLLQYAKANGESWFSLCRFDWNTYKPLELVLDIVRIQSVNGQGQMFAVEGDTAYLYINDDYRYLAMDFDLRTI